MIPRTQLINQQCILYAHQERADWLVEILDYMGFGRFSTDDIMTRAEELEVEWDYFGRERQVCYVCHKPQVGGCLCACYNTVAIAPWNIPQLMAIIPNDVILARYLCGKCRTLTELPAFQVKKKIFQKRGPQGVFKFPHHCQPCFINNNQRRPHHVGAKVRDSVEPTKLETLQNVVANQTETPTS